MASLATLSFMSISIRSSMVVELASLSAIVMSMGVLMAVAVRVMVCFVMTVRPSCGNSATVR